MTLSGSYVLSEKQNEKLLRLLITNKNEGQVGFAFCRNCEVNLCIQNVLKHTVLIYELTDNTKGKQYYQLAINLSFKTDGEPK